MKISVCIPCYNSEKYIDGLFECLENQTFKDFDVVFLNDGSTDNTLEKLKEKIKNTKMENKIHLFTQENKGLSFSRNFLIENAKGDYIFFLDSDDIIPNNSLEKLWSNSNNGTIDIVVGRAKVRIKKFDYPFFVLYRYSKEITNIHFVKSNLCVCWGAIFRREIFENEKFLENYCYEDIGLINYIFMKAKSFKAIKDNVYFYCRRSDGLSSFSKENMWRIVDCYNQTEYALKKYADMGWLNDKKKTKAINGTLFQILIVMNWLSKHYSKNKLIKIMPTLSIKNLLNTYNLNLSFSKTFWKSLAFFYINLLCRRSNKFYKIKKQNKLLNKLVIHDCSNVVNKDNKIYLVENKKDEYLITNNKNAVFLTTNKDIKLENAHYGIKPKKITNDLLKEEKIYFIDLIDHNNLSQKELDIINKINKRIIIISNDDSLKGFNVFSLKKNK